MAYCVQYIVRMSSKTTGLLLINCIAHGCIKNTSTCPVCKLATLLLITTACIKYIYIHLSYNHDHNHKRNNYPSVNFSLKFENSCNAMYSSNNPVPMVCFDSSISVLIVLSGFRMVCWIVLWNSWSNYKTKKCYCNKEVIWINWICWI